MLSVILSLILILGFLKTLLYLKVFRHFGQIIRLFYNVTTAAASFMIFFHLCNGLFALIYQINGVDYGGHPDDRHGSGDDYERLTKFLAYFIYTYRGSIGDIEAPNAILWTKLMEDPQPMVYLIWFVWMTH